jgi:dihydrosphingosine 1-phosphate phosphatase
MLVPVVIISLGALLVNQHAEPVDDCPCFEDAIAFVSVVIGTTLGQWHAANWGFDMKSGYFASKTPGWEGKDLGDWLLWLGFSAMKMIVG